MTRLTDAQLAAIAADGEAHDPAILELCGARIFLVAVQECQAWRAACDPASAEAVQRVGEAISDLRGAGSDGVPRVGRGTRKRVQAALAAIRAAVMEGGDAK